MTADTASLETPQGALEDRYFARMAASLGEKSALVKYSVPGTVLNVGAGGPELSLAFQDAGHPVISLDSSPDSCRKLREAGLSDVIMGNAENILALIEEPVHNIVFSSVLHEVFSYAAGDKYGTVREMLQKAWQVLEPGGRILIRDGVKPMHDDVTLKAKTVEDALLIEGYLRRSPFVPDPVSVTRVDEMTWEGDLTSATEILNTINWGPDSLRRECRELFGIFTVGEYITELQQAGFVDCASILSRKTYRRHLENRAVIIDSQSRELWVPPTHSWIASKPI